MSAYICAPETFGLLAAYAAGNGSDNSIIYDWRTGGGVEDAKSCAKELAKENIRSVSCRYPNDRDGQRPGPQLYDAEIIEAAALWAEHYYYRFPRNKVGPVDVLVLCRGYSYQACESNNWTQTLAHRQIDWIQGKAIRSLPKADDAPWSWNDDQEPNSLKVFYGAIGERQME